MFTRFGLSLALAVTLGVLAMGGGREVSAADKVVTLSPSSGAVGTVVTAELFNALPNEAITVIFKIPGDPILATGTTDATGHATFTFTIPYVPGGGTWPIFFTNFKCSCQIAVDFTVLNIRPTATPTFTPTVPLPTATPITPLPTVTATPTASPTATPTPGVPVLGTTTLGGGSGPNVGVLALGFMAVVTVLAWFAATRRGPGSPAFAVAMAPDDGPDYSTELDLNTLEALRRPFRRDVAVVRKGGAAWAIGAGLSAIAGVVLLRKK